MLCLRCQCDVEGGGDLNKNHTASCLGKCVCVCVCVCGCVGMCVCVCTHGEMSACCLRAATYSIVALLDVGDIS